MRKGFETYLHRSTLFSLCGWQLFLHRWFGDDEPLLHDHSRSMLSIGLWGSYCEHLANGKARHWTAPWCRWFKATHTHYITLLSPTVWTLVLAGPQKRRSGFWIDGRWVWSPDYLRNNRAK